MAHTCSNAWRLGSHLMTDHTLMRQQAAESPAAGNSARNYRSIMRFPVPLSEFSVSGENDAVTNNGTNPLEAKEFHKIIWLTPLALCYYRPTHYMFRYLLIFLGVIFTDAWLASGWTFVGGPDTALFVVQTFIFVVLGDVRYFLLIFHFGVSPTKALLKSLIPSSTITLLEIAIHYFYFTTVPNLQTIFLIYEGAYVVFLPTMYYFFLRKGKNFMTDDIRIWLTRVTKYEFFQYFTWFVSDIIVAAGSNFGYWPRTGADLAYYCFFLPYVLWTLPTHHFLDERSCLDMKSRIGAATPAEKENAANMNRSDMVHQEDLDLDLDIHLEEIERDNMRQKETSQFLPSARTDGGTADSDFIDSARSDDDESQILSRT